MSSITEEIIYCKCCKGTGKVVVPDYMVNSSDTHNTLYVELNCSCCNGVGKLKVTTIIEKMI